MIRHVECKLNLSISLKGIFMVTCGVGVDVSLGETLSGETTAIRVYNSQFT